MKHAKTSFVFTVEHGRRLQELRRKQGLRLKDLARLMDRHRPGSDSVLSRLEHGRIRFPSMALVMDFLRACRATTSDIADMLDKYLRQEPAFTKKGDAAVGRLLEGLPAAERAAMLSYEKKTTHGREQQAAAEPLKREARVLTPDQRTVRILRMFVKAALHEVLEQKLHHALKTLAGKLRPSERKNACRHGRRVFGVMLRTWGVEERRPRKLETARLRAGKDGLNEEVATAMTVAAVEAFFELERTGKLDWMPSARQILAAGCRAPRVERAEVRLEFEEFRPTAEYCKACSLVAIMVDAAVTRTLERLRLDFATRRPLQNWVNRLVGIAIEHGVGSPEWQADVEATVPRVYDPELGRAIVKQVVEEFERWKVRIPPKPERPA